MVPEEKEVGVLRAGCESRRVLDLIADKWTTLVIYALGQNGTRRFGELNREVEGISQKMLTQTLRRLERDGLVRRKVYPEVPPRVEYALTELGASLCEPLRALCRWAEEHLPEMDAPQERATAENKENIT